MIAYNSYKHSEILYVFVHNNFIPVDGSFGKCKSVEMKHFGNLNMGHFGDVQYLHRSCTCSLVVWHSSTE